MSAVTAKMSSKKRQSWRPQFLDALVKKPRTFWIAFWGTTALALLPFLIPYGITLSRQELYQYFPFVVLGIGYLVYFRWDRNIQGPSTTFNWSLVWLGLIVVVAATTIHSTWLGNIAFVCLSYAFLRSHNGLDGKSLGYLSLPLLMLVRIPQLHANSLVTRLQGVTSQLSDLALDLMAVPHDSFGNRLRLPGKELFVAEACSGIQSAFTMCFVALLMIVWKRRQLLLTPVYVFFALVFAILANTVRVTAIAIADVWFGLDWTSGWIHDGVGYFSLATAIGAMWSFDKLLELIFHPVEVSVSKRGANPISTAWNWLLGAKVISYEETGYSWNSAKESDSQLDEVQKVKQVERPRKAMLVVGLASICGIIMLSGMALGRSDFRPITSKEALLFDPPKDLLGNRVGVLSIGGHEVVRNGSDPQLGLHADVWQCNSSNAAGQLVMSQPYVGWHELCVCYEVQEWGLDKRYNLPVPAGKPVAVGEFSKGEDMRGYLFFTAIDTDGNVPTPPSYTLFGRLMAPFIPLITDDYAETSGSAQTVMLQLWTVSDRELQESEMVEIAKSIADAREAARQSLIEYQQKLVSPNA